MNFLLDHDVPDDVVYSLVALGNQVDKLRDVLPMTADDELHFVLRRTAKGLDYL